MLSPGTTGRTRREGIAREEATWILAVPARGRGWEKDQIGCSPFGAEIVTRIREPAR
jgi:hypothetical protein